MAPKLVKKDLKALLMENEETIFSKGTSEEGVIITVESGGLVIERC